MTIVFPKMFPSIQLSRVRYRRSRQAARSLGFAVVVFVTSTIGFGIWAEPKGWFRDPIYCDKQNALQALIAKDSLPLVLFSGSSRVANGFDAGKMEIETGNRLHAFNLAVPGAGPFAQLTYLQRILNANIQPKLVILEILPILLEEKSDGPRERIWMRLNQLTRREKQEFVRLGWPAENLEPEGISLSWVDYRLSILGRTLPSFIPPKSAVDWSRTNDAHGWDVIAEDDYSKERTERAQAIARKEYELLLKNLAFGGASIQALQASILECRTRGIEVHLILMPESTTFRSWYGPGVNDRLMTTIHTLNAPTTDAREWIPDHEFIDGHHLYRTGAKRFTERLSREVVIPVLKESLP